MPADTIEGLKLIEENPSYVYLTDSTILEYYTGQRCNKYFVAPEIFDPTGFAFVTPRGAPYLDQLSY